MKEHEHIKNSMCCGNPVSAKSISFSKPTISLKSIVREEKVENKSPDRHGEHR